jgi:hypothetical protein
MMATVELMAAIWVSWLGGMVMCVRGVGEDSRPASDEILHTKPHINLQVEIKLLFY